MAEVETFTFHAELAQLMSLIVDIFYYNKGISIRGLILNADKVDWTRDHLEKQVDVNNDSKSQWTGQGSRKDPLMCS